MDEDGTLTCEANNFHSQLLLRENKPFNKRRNLSLSEVA